MKHEKHVCPMNDGDQSCDCYDAGYEAGKKFGKSIASFLTELERFKKEYDQEFQDTIKQRDEFAKMYQEAKKEVREQTIDEIKLKVNGMTRFQYPDELPTDHEFIDTCKIYKCLQALNDIKGDNGR